jgi:hypothetical protein
MDPAVWFLSKKAASLLQVDQMTPVTERQVRELASEPPCPIAMTQPNQEI